MSILLVAEHDNADLKPATRSALAAAAKIGGAVDLLVAGEGCGAVAQAAAKLPGVDRIRLPGEMRAARRRDRAANGVPIPTALMAQLERLAAETDTLPLSRR